MARFCEPCRFHSVDDSLTACPQCGGPVKFTLLPPPNATPEPMALDLESESAPAAILRNNRMTWYLVGGAAALIACVGLGLLLTGNLGEGFDARAKKIKSGMAMEQAAGIMGETQKPAGKKWSFTFGEPESHAEPMPDFDRPMDYSGEGYVVYEGSTSGLKIHFRDGVVTRVEEVAREGGMRKRITVTR